MSDMRVLPLLTGLVWICGTLSACGPHADGNRNSVADSSGVTVVFSRLPAFSEPQVVVASPSLSIGDSVELHDVVGAVRLSDGRIVIADGGNAAILYISSDGAPLAKLGRHGDGPTEFRTLQAIGKSAGDTVWAYDFAHRRITVVAPDASIAREITLRPTPSAALAVGVLPDGDIVIGESWSSARVAAAAQAGLNREPVAYLRYSATGELIDTLGVFLGREVLLSQENGRTVMSSAPMGRAAVHAVANSWVVVGEQVSHEIKFFESSGALKRIVRWDGSDLRVNSELEAAWREARLASVVPEDRARLARQLDEQRVPTQRPAFGQILAVESGGLWVADYTVGTDTPGTWFVFNADHQWRGSLTMPARFQPLSAGAGWVLGVSRDDLDVQRVELRALQPAN